MGFKPSTFSVSTATSWLKALDLISQPIPGPPCLETDGTYVSLTYPVQLSARSLIELNCMCTEQELHNSSLSTVPQARNLSITFIGHLRRQVMERINLNLVSHISPLVESARHTHSSERKEAESKKERDTLMRESTMTNISILMEYALLLLPWRINRIICVSLPGKLESELG